MASYEVYFMLKKENARGVKTSVLKKGGQKTDYFIDSVRRPNNRNNPLYF